MRMSELDISRTRLNELVTDYVWNARNKAIFYRKIEGETYEAIAEEFNLSTQQTKAIVKDWLQGVAPKLYYETMERLHKI